MTAAERAKNILLSAKLGPLTPFFGIVNGRCECGKPKSQKHKPGKHPHGGGWQHNNATSDPATIALWIGQYPNANFAVITGIDTVVLDLTFAPAKMVLLNWPHSKRRQDRRFRPPSPFSPAAGPAHSIGTSKFRQIWHGSRSPKEQPQLISSATVRQVIVPGSLHESGNSYRFAPGLSPDQVEVADLPAWILALMQKNAASHSKHNHDH